MEFRIQRCTLCLFFRAQTFGTSRLAGPARKRGTFSMRNHPITRRHWLAATGVIAAALALPAQGNNKPMQAIREMLEKA
jgi:hypothetical protein